MSIKKIISSIDKLESLPNIRSSRSKKLLSTASNLVSKIHVNSSTYLENQLQVRLTALKYRSGLKQPRINGRSKIEQQLLIDAMNWKSKQINFKSSRLSSKEIEKIKEVCRYRSFAKLLIKQDSLKMRFFKWTLQNDHLVPIFVQYPALSERIRECLLEGRLGVTHSLKYNEKNKDVLIRTEKGKLFSLLNSKNRVYLNKRDSITVNEIFEIFRKKNTEEGRLTFQGKGLSNWDPHRFGRLNGKTGKFQGIDLERSKWYAQLKSETIVSKHIASKIFGVPCDGKKWVISVAATRQVKGKLTMAGSHTFMRFAYPDSQGNYHCSYPISKFPLNYPKNIIDTIDRLFGFTAGTLELPDNNLFYTHREKKEIHFLNTPSRSLKMMESIRQDLIASKEKNLPFQYLIDNCTHWVVRKIKKYVYKDIEHLFAEDFNRIRAGGFLGLLVRITKKMPTIMQVVVLYSFCFAFGGWRRKSFRINGRKKNLYLLDPSNWKNKKFIHPGIFFNKIYVNNNN